mgnify:FL=1
MGYRPGHPFTLPVLSLSVAVNSAYSVSGGWEKHRGDELMSAPVVLLGFNRPEVTQRVVDRVVEAQPKTVYLVADGPREHHQEDEQLCARVRTIMTAAPWSGEVHTLFADSNLGLKNRVTSGLDWVFENEDRAIILEDDCLPDLSFFAFAMELLERYADDSRVGMISGNNFLRGHRLDENSYFFTSDARIWGWATWKRTWQEFSEQSAQKKWTRDEVMSLAAQLPANYRRTSLANTARNINSLDTWDVGFLLHCLSRKYLNVTPAKNLVTNIGFGRGATHTKFESFTAEVPSEELTFPLEHPANVTAADGAGWAESRALWRRRLVFPLAHPIDLVGRIIRYLARRRQR